MTRDLKTNTYYRLVLNVLFTRALTKHLSPSSSIIATSVNPGFCISDLRRSLGEEEFQELLKTARTSEEGSRPYLYATFTPTAEDLANGLTLDDIRGGYVSDNKVVGPNPWVLTEEGSNVQELVWVDLRL